MVEGKLSRIVTFNVINSHLVISEDNGTANSAVNSAVSSNSQNPVVPKPNAAWNIDQTTASISVQPEAELNFLQNNATFHSLKMLIIILCLINFL